MKKIFTIAKVAFLAFTLSFSNQSFSVDIVKMLKPLLGADKRAKHKDEVVVRALEITKAEFGPYVFSGVDVDMTPGRALSSVKAGDIINLSIHPENELWEKGAISIKVPLRQGLLSYRLLLIHEDNLDKFSKVMSLEDLSKLSAGLQSNWVTTTLFNKLGLLVNRGHSFEGLFLMLQKKRFDYLPRAIYEVYDELEARKLKLGKVVIEPNIALYIPMATYIYVSPKEPLLAKRLEVGLKKMVENGELREILEKYYSAEVKQANIKNRRIIYIENPFFKHPEVMKNKDLWYFAH